MSQRGRRWALCMPCWHLAPTRCPWAPAPPSFACFTPLPPHRTMAALATAASSLVAAPLARRPAGALRGGARAARGARHAALRVQAAVKFDYPTKVFEKELVK